MVRSTGPNPGWVNGPFVGTHLGAAQSGQPLSVAALVGFSTLAGISTRKMGDSGIYAFFSKVALADKQ